MNAPKQPKPAADGHKSQTRQPFLQRKPADGQRTFVSKINSLNKQMIGSGGRPGLSTVLTTLADPLSRVRTRLMDRINDTSWMSSLLSRLNLNAHPIHRDKMESEIFYVFMEAINRFGILKSEVMQASSAWELYFIEGYLNKFLHDYQHILEFKVLEIIHAYREREKEFLYEFLSHPPIATDPVTFNLHDTSRLEFHPGVQSVVKVVTRIKYNWSKTDLAASSGMPDWTQSEKEKYQKQFQYQLNNVWDTQKNTHPPFLLAHPQDYLLKNESIRWSNLRAHMHGEVQDAGGGDFHYDVNVIKAHDTEYFRPGVGIGAATFYQSDAQSGIVPETGEPSSGQQTLAHEWGHLIGMPDEYPESSMSNETDWNACRAHFAIKRMLAWRNPALRQQLDTDLSRLSDQYGSIQTPTGISRNIYHLSDPHAIPDVCFAARTKGRLRPGGLSGPGGAFIVSSMENEKRISFAGNEVHPYHRDGVLQKLNAMLASQTTQGVQYAHNFTTIDYEKIKEVLITRLSKL